MVEIAYLKEKDKAKTLPEEVQKFIEEILDILDTEYGDDRDVYGDLGGYVLISEEKKDFGQVLEHTNIDCKDCIPKYVDKIVCTNGAVYVNELVLLNND